MEQQKLGRGLSALFDSNIADNNPKIDDNHPDKSDQNQKSERKNIQKTVLIDLIIPNKNQPRIFFDSSKLQELSDSIALHGIIQPLTVRQIGNEYHLLAGERRLRAAKMAGLTEIPVHVINCEDNDVLALSLIENIQRDDLTPIEEAEAMENLISEHNCTQENLAFLICKSRSYISNSLRLLSLPDDVKSLVRAGGLSAGHARCLVGVENSYQIAIKAMTTNMSVRELEELVKINKDKSTPSSWTPIKKEEDPDIKELSDRISKALGLKTNLKVTSSGGIVTIRCKSCEELESLTSTLLSINQ